MEDRKPSAREAALIAQARREAEARKAGTPAAARPAAPQAPQPPLKEKRRETPEERLARLMAEEHAETERRKKKMRRYGIFIPATIIALFALWVLRAPRRGR
jgi:hypothetical protein